MIIFVLGKPDSGKSLKAEELATKSGAKHKIYIATMKVMDQAGEERVKRHRRQRAGKGFETMEIPMKISLSLPILCKPKEAVPEETVILLECLSNLVGNEMHDNPMKQNLDEQEFAKELINEIGLLSKAASLLIVVGTMYEIKEDFDEETRKYIRYLNRTNEEMKKISDRIIE